MDYLNDRVFKKFDAAVSDATQNDSDPTLLFIATDGRRVYKAFTGRSSATGSLEPVFCEGFDDDVFIGMWSHEWMMDAIKELETKPDPDADWGQMMERMVMEMSDYADRTETRRSS
jgi:hypothetical protein